MAYSKQLRASSRNEGSCDTRPQGPNHTSVPMVFPRNATRFYSQMRFCNYQTRPGGPRIKFKGKLKHINGGFRIIRSTETQVHNGIEGDLLYIIFNAS